MGGNSNLSRDKQAMDASTHERAHGDTRTQTTMSRVMKGCRVSQ